MYATKIPIHRKQATNMPCHAEKTTEICFVAKINGA